MWGIIGGSGFEKFDGFKVIKELGLETPFGNASSGLKLIEINGTNALFISRHGASHELTPSEVNYRANIFALKKFGATKILSISAVGSLRNELKPGDLVVPSQYIDRTKGIRPFTFCGEGVVGHVSQANPTSLQLQKYVQEIAGKFSFDIHFGKTYVCIEGPTFSTKSESHMYRMFGADIIGMTNVPECHLAKEAGLGYLPLSFVTDYDCWKDDVPHVTLQEVINIMRKNNSKAFDLCLEIIPKTTKLEVDEKNQGLKTSLMSSIENLSESKKKWLEIILR